MIQGLQNLRNHPRARPFSTILAVVSFALMMITAIGLRPSAELMFLNESFIVFLCGALCLLIAFWLRQPFPVLTNKPIRQHAPNPIYWRSVALGIACLALLTQINITTSLRAIDHPMLRFGQATPHMQFALFLAGILLLIYGFSGEMINLGAIGNRLTRAVNPRNWRPHHWFLLGILVIAFFARIWNLEDAIRRYLDELFYARATYDIRTHDYAFLLQPFSEITAFTSLFPYFQSFTVELFSANFFSLRIIAVIFGILQIIGTYLLAKELFHRRIAIISALLLASLPVHIQFSRVGIANIADPCMAVFGFYFLVRGIRTQRPLFFALAGISIALTSYFYEGGRLFYLPFVMCWLIWITLFSKHLADFRFPSNRNIRIFIASLLPLIIILYYTWLVDGYSLIPRLEDRGRPEEYWLGLQDLDQTFPATILRPLVDPVLALIHLPDQSWFFGGRTALIMPILVPFFLFGLVTTFTLIRRVNGSLVFWWIAGTIVSVSIIRDPVNAPRYVVVLPALMIAVALGIDTLLGMLLEHHSRLHSRLVYTIAVLLAVYQWNYYFGELLPNFYSRSVYTVHHIDGRLIGDLDDALFRASRLPDLTIVYIVNLLPVWDFDRETVTLYYERKGEIDLRYLSPNELTAEFFEKLDRARNNAFFIESTDTNSLTRFERYLPDLEPQQSTYPVPLETQLYLYFLPARP